MRPTRLFAGVSLFAGSVWMTPLISEILGTSQIFGFVTVGGALAFVSGAVFHSGLSGRRCK